jgi:predicted DNA repair protein MutK
MAGASLFTLLDDLAALLDDVAAMTKVATKKTSGVLGDDLALNAEQVAGVSTDREWPVVWAVAKRSLVNKALLVPAALAISAFLPVLVKPLLMVGGAFLCFEGVEKLLAKKGHATQPAAPLTEAQRIAGAVRTDFILSAEIIVIALGSVAEAPLLQQLLTLVALSLLMTVGVYGLVAGIVKLDDAGLALSKRGGASAAVGRGLVAVSPKLMKGLSVAGTVAMFLVGGGIIGHGIPPVHAWLEPMSDALAAALEGVLGLLTGGLLVVVVAAVRAVRRRGPAGTNAAQTPGP